MPVSRIAFALHDAVSEIRALSPGGHERPGFAVDLYTDHETHEAVVKELEYHFGCKLQRDKDWRGVGKAVRYGGLRLIPIAPGRKNG